MKNGRHRVFASNVIKRTKATNINFLSVRPPSYKDKWQRELELRLKDQSFVNGGIPTFGKIIHLNVYHVVGNPSLKCAYEICLCYTRIFDFS